MDADKSYSLSSKGWHDFIFKGGALCLVAWIAFPVVAVLFFPQFMSLGTPRQPGLSDFIVGPLMMAALLVTYVLKFARSISASGGRIYVQRYGRSMDTIMVDDVLEIGTQQGLLRIRYRLNGTLRAVWFLASSAQKNRFVALVGKQIVQL